MLIGGVIDDELGNHPNAAGVSGADKMTEIRQRPVIRMHFPVGADVVAVVEARRRIKWQQPDRGGAEFGDVVEF